MMIRAHYSYNNKSFSKHNFFLSCFVLQAPSIDEKVDLHFIALVNVGGHLYELGKNTFYPLSICLKQIQVVMLLTVKSFREIS